MLLPLSAKETIFLIHSATVRRYLVCLTSRLFRRPRENLPESLSQRILVLRFLVRRLAASAARDWNPPRDGTREEGGPRQWMFITGGCSGKGGAVDGGSIM